MQYLQHPSGNTYMVHNLSRLFALDRRGRNIFCIVHIICYSIDLSNDLGHEPLSQPHSARSCTITEQKLSPKSSIQVHLSLDLKQMFLY